ncbi:MAG: CDP-alcohol phosphatidyltransferase family protein [Clostridia bacterium]|nr:CDP-alcohol phosphatidyltransferase family protein [Clostridia bacterium]
MKINPNAITAVRIIGTFCLLFTTPFSEAYYIIYTLSGISDGLDGFVARKTNQTTEFGAKLDSVADLLFYSVMIIKIFPTLWEKLPIGVWCGVGAIVVIRLAAYAVAAIKYKCFTSLHTYMNKVTGFFLFLVPYVINTAIGVGVCIVICVLGGLASVEELIIHIKNKEYNPKNRTLIKLV